MTFKHGFKASAIATALFLAGCGGDININEGNITNNIDNSTVINNPPPAPGPGPAPGPAPTPDPTPEPTGPSNPFDQGLASDVSAEFPMITDKPVYRLNNNTTFTQDVTLTANAHWILSGRTAVGGDNIDNATLFIEAGVTIIGGAGEDFLVVRRGSKIEAHGRADAPIVMTSIQDVTGQETDMGQWGGLVVLGRAPANSCGDQVGDTTPEELENCGVSAEGDAGQFGGPIADDNSGTIRYVVVKHAGRTLGNGDELNGITLAGVGSGTKVEYIQVHQNLDDGLEFFGGTVNVSHVVLTANGDDSLDWSFGWTGHAQFVYIQQDSAEGDNAIEADNSEFDAAARPLTKPRVSNVTIVGAPNTNGVRLRAGTAGLISNMVVVGPEGYNNCLRVNGNETVERALEGQLAITGSVVACADADQRFTSGNIGSQTTEEWFLSQENNQILTEGQLGLAADGYTPLPGSVLLTSGVSPRAIDPALEDARYVGAFDGQNNWMRGWTVGVNGGFPNNVSNAFEQGLATDVSSQFPQITDKPVYLLGLNTTFTADVTLTNDAHWILNGRTAVGGDNVDNATLFIQHDTTLIGQAGEDFLVVRRGSKIQALGLPNAPIIMTSIQDVTGQETDMGQWGGLVVLGRAPANSCGDQVGTVTPEELENCGVAAEGDAGQFGGPIDDDDSGTIQYLLVKYAGRTLGNGDELNGITLAGVGSKTNIHHIQVHKNLDDGLEFFGGSVSVRYVVLTENGDDSLDWSFGWTGNAQFVYIVQDESEGDNAIEADNSEFDAAARPLTNPTISNITIQGDNNTNGIRLRAGTAGKIHNLVITGPDDYRNCLRVNGAETQALATAGELLMTHSTIACSEQNNFDSDFSRNWFVGQPTNSVTTPDSLRLRVDGRTPADGSPLLGSGLDLSETNPFFLSTNYQGAFDGRNDWTKGWAFLPGNFPTNLQNAFEQGLATDVSNQFPQITDKPVYLLGLNTTFTRNVTLTNDAHWILNGRTAVGNDNVDPTTLWIEQGTTLIGQAGEDFLVVRRGSKIQALGTKEMPINMTSIQDMTGQETDMGQWGGLVILGRAPANNCGNQVGTVTPEEMENCGVAAEGDAGQFGGPIADDNSGTIRYVVVKHAGRTLGNGDELNGITLAGVGSGTKVEYIQVHKNLDDGLEFFGGTVSVKHVVLTANGDDSLDWSFGWNGSIQFVLIKQDEAEGDNGIEADNSEFDAAARPLTEPKVANVTILGDNNTNGIRLRAGTAGSLWNVVVTGPQDYRNCLRVNGAESQALATAGVLVMRNSIVACSEANNFDSDFSRNWFTGEETNRVLAPSSLGFAANGYQPAPGSPLLQGAIDVKQFDNFFDSVDFVGAVGPDDDWTQGWVTVGLE